jgi:hypothetical protein
MRDTNGKQADTGLYLPVQGKAFFVGLLGELDCQKDLFPLLLALRFSLLLSNGMSEREKTPSLLPPRHSGRPPCLNT